MQSFRRIVESVKTGIFSRYNGVRQAKTSSPCVICGCEEAFLVPTVVQPDFDPSCIPKELRNRFLVKENGYCCCCGFFQDFCRPSSDDFRIINALGKDFLSSDLNSTSHERLESIHAHFSSHYFKKRLVKWARYFDRNDVDLVDDVLFLRFFYGDAVKFVKDRFSPKTMVGAEISQQCVDYTSNLYPELDIVSGQLNGLLEGDFLEGPRYDLAFCFHLLAHASDPREFLDRLLGSLKREAVVIFTHEIERKTANPFHFSHFSEWTLTSLLREYFSKVDRIDDCQNGEYLHVSGYTRDNDVPDFACRV